MPDMIYFARIRVVIPGARQNKKLLTLASKERHMAILSPISTRHITLTVGKNRSYEKATASIVSSDENT